MRLCLIHLISQIYHLRIVIFFKRLKNFLQEKIFKKRDSFEGAFREIAESRNSEFYTNIINKLVCLWQNYVDANDL